MKNKYFYMILLIGIFYIGLYLLLLDNINLWLFDLKNCYKIMTFKWFIISHINIFAYLAIFLVMTYFLLKTIYIIFYETKKAFILYSDISKLQIKKFKNIIVIDISENLAFNLFNKIILSKNLIKKLNKKQVRSIYLHEKGHLISKDSFKIFISNIILSLFPKKIKILLLRHFILSVENNADKFAVKKTDKYFLMRTLLDLTSLKSSYPLANNFIEERIKLLLENKEVKPPKIIYLIYSLFVISLFLLVIYEICFCGVM